MKSVFLLYYMFSMFYRFLCLKRCLSNMQCVLQDFVSVLFEYMTCLKVSVSQELLVKYNGRCYLCITSFRVSGFHKMIVMFII
jgi:hypothetical protein